MTIVGESGVGKSTLIAQVLKNYPAVDTPTGYVIPVLAADVPKPTSVKGVATTLLSRLGDPQPDRGNTVSQTERLYKLLVGCQVEMVILDEFQHLLDGKTDRVIGEVSDFVKTLINRSRIPFVLVGMPSLRAIFEGPQQIQLRSRFMHQMTLEPFKWLPDNGEEYRMFLRQIESTLPFREPSNLADFYRAMRLFVGTQGYLRYTMRLVKTAARRAMKAGLPCITEEILASSFSMEVGDSGFVLFNPFVVDSRKVEASLKVAARQQVSGPGSNRIKAKKKTDAANTAKPF